EVKGDVNITISGGSMGNVYGGGWAQKENGKSIVGNVNITVSDGIIANVFGGGSHSTSGGTTETGAVTITVSGGNITGSIYAMGQFQNDTVASSTVVFTGAEDFNCEVSGKSYVGGGNSNADLFFTGYTGTFKGNIVGFDGGITLDEDTVMTFSAPEEGTQSITNAKWEFDVSDRAETLADTALLDWAAADFAGDTIAIDIAGGSTTEWSLVNAASATAYNQFDVLVDDVSILGGTTLTLDQAIEASVSADYAGWGFTVEDTVLKFKQLA
ncbi:MAG: hypothetical protein IKT12_02205, partial [Thermoguttaceae bacterium]|nr:hypothetical protein [Thermoguttaceae bacterium]